ncbi:MAG: YchF/TatD family DNA exonuclease [Candidatus Omnitrophica bacterium]|nr:YchF/TatD family DNA exonuclease [Candidatus Omnitrophota bacterium]
MTPPPGGRGMKLVDTHCHLHRAEFDADREQVLERARGAGVAAILDPAVELASNRAVVELAGRHPDVYGAVGVHPHHAQELTDAGFQELASLAVNERVAAIGEIGLDYYRELCPRQTQKEALRQLLRLAHELNKPVILHCRDAAQQGAGQAYADLFATLREMLKPPIRGLLHCFSGDLAAAREGLELGLYLSFAGNLTFPSAEPLRAVAKEVPFDRVVLETDAPFLSPQGRRGKRNESAYLPELVETWARIKGLTPEDVARVTTANAHHVLGIGPAPERGRVAYVIRNSLYINLTNACTDRCLFCALSDEQFWKGEGTSPFVKGHHLRMARDPSVDQVLAEAGDPARYEEVVFCGYGEPIIRLKELLEAGRRLREKGARRIRLNTNGHGNLIHKRSVARELKGVLDEVSVSLNTPDARQYLEICRPAFGLETYDSIKQFIRECRDEGMKVVATVVALPGVDVEACRKVATDELRVGYRVRTYDDVG